MSVAVPCGTLLVPTAAVALWALYLRLQISSDGGAGEIRRDRAPLRRVLPSPHQLLDRRRASRIWSWEWVSWLLLFVYLRRVVASDDLVGWAFLPFTVLGILLTEQVWRSYFDITRAIAPVITALLCSSCSRTGRTGLDRRLVHSA